MLTRQLADHYRSAWVPEYAREYIDNLDRPYVESDILEIARGQAKLEKMGSTSLRKEATLGKVQQRDRFLFCDTEALVTKIWSDVKFGRCDPWILDLLETHVYDLYLLCDIDIPWEYDPQREHPEMRVQLFNLYYEELLERHRNFRVVSGLGEDRLENAINFIDSCFT